MTRAWWLKGALYGLLVAAAVVVLIPSVVRSDSLPPFLAKHARRMRPAVDVAGGIRLVYEVDAEAAAAGRLQVLAPDLERLMRKELTAPDLTVEDPERD